MFYVFDPGIELMVVLGLRQKGGLKVAGVGLTGVWMRSYMLETGSMRAC